MNSLTATAKKKKKKFFTNVVGTQGSIQFICRPIALHSNILNLAKSPIEIGTVRLAPILLFPISETFCFLGLLLACHSRNPVGSLSVQQVSLTFILTALIDLCLLDSSRNQLFYSFRTIPVHSLMQTSRISTWFIMNYVKFARFTKLPKCADQQNKFQNSLFNGNYFPKHFIFYRYMDTPSKVSHTKYAVAETCISSVKLITVIHVLKLFVYNHC